MPEAVKSCLSIREYGFAESGISSGKVSSVVVVLIPETTGEKLSNRRRSFANDFFRQFPLTVDKSEKAMFQQLGVNRNLAS